MTIDERADGTVVVSYDSLGLTRVMLAAAVWLLAVAGHNDILAGGRGTERLVGLLGAAATCDAIRVLREEEGLSLVDAKRRVEELIQSNGYATFDEGKPA